MNLNPLSADGRPWALGWTLVHFLWQGTLIAVVLACVLALLHKRSAQLRYVICCFALGLMIIAPLITLKQLSYSGTHVEPKAAPTIPDRLLLPVAHSLRLHDSQLQGFIAAMDRAMPLLLALWLTGVVILLVRLGIGLLVTSRMKRIGVRPTSAELERSLQLLLHRLSVARPVRLVYSALVQVPTVIGWLSPVILIPVGFLTGLSAVQVEAILVHELAHIRRHDYLVSVLQAIAEAALFYHPAVWWVSKRIRTEREHCCDDLAVATVGSPILYARALSLLEERRSERSSIVLAANGGVLTMRIQRILGLAKSPSLPQPAAVLLLGTMIACIFVTTIGTAQTRCSPEIKLDVPGLPEPDRLSVLETLRKDTSCSANRLSEQALWMIHDLGYFKAALTPETITDASASAPTVAITLGAQYHFGGFIVHGNHTLTPQQVQAAYALHPGDLVTFTLIGKTLENLQKSYAQAGFKNEVTEPSAHVNEQTHLVTMELQVDEGT
jgi:beta-lactamase regulating signal transducer with metallopeptidase domain